MLDRACLGRFPAKHHIALFNERGELFFEHCLTRRGFEGPYSILYHRNPPPRDIGQRPAEITPDPPVVGSPSAALKRRHYHTFQPLSEQGSFGPKDHIETRRILLSNEDVALGISRPSESAGRYLQNGDGDELYYVYQGTGKLISLFGVLDYFPGDYLLIPRGVLHRFVPTKPGFFFLIEGRSYIEIPKEFRNASGQLRLDAPYCHRDFRRPQDLSPPSPQTEFRKGAYPILVKRGGRYHEILREEDPLDVVGWDGAVYPIAFSIHDYQAKVGRVHLPPTVFATFAGGGFLVCSFVPRLVDYDDRAIPCPYPHSNVDCDEVIFYVSGDFTSRRGVGPGSLSYHPSGIPHGPHPRAYDASLGKKRTEELAVMIDTFRPLYPTEDAAALEDPSYHASWQRPPEEIP